MAQMTAQEAAEWGKTLDFPTVWAALMENRTQIDKLAEKVDRVTANVDGLNKLAEKLDRVTANADGLNKPAEKIDRVNTDADEADRRLSERLARVSNVYEIDIHELDKLKAKIETFDKDTFNELKEKVEDVSKNVGGLNLSMGDLVEVLFAPHLGEKFDIYNYNLKRIFRRVPIYDDNGRMRSDIDFLLSDTTMCMAVEVKCWLEHKKDIDEHIKRMQLIRQYPPPEAKGKKLLGAIVGALVHPDVRAYAEQNGFFVLELTGRDVHLLEPPKDFQPKEW